MAKKRYENPAFTLLLFAVLIGGIMVCYLDPTSILAGRTHMSDIGALSSLNMALFVLGLFLMVLGGGIRTVAIATLRLNFSGLLRIREGHTLTKNGIYRYIRHPAYLGAILLFLGIPVLFSSILGFLVMLLLIPILLHRIKLEEKMLTEHFGAEYQEYVRSSKKLIPFLY